MSGADCAESLSAGEAVFVPDNRARWTKQGFERLLGKQWKAIAPVLTPLARCGY